MGCNFYAIAEDRNGGPGGFEIHIGQSAIGWRFLFHEYPDKHQLPDAVRDQTEKITSFLDWLNILLRPGVKIEDEYGRTRKLSYFVERVIGAQTEKSRVDVGEGSCVRQDMYGFEFCDSDFC
jgi:hypothetical protein